MYTNDTNQTGDISHLSVKIDIINKGWVVLEPSTDECIYDLVVDFGNGRFERIQIKTLANNTQLTKYKNRNAEVVSKNGKTRNSVDYAASGIEWLVGVNKQTNQVYYYHISNYEKIESHSFSVNKYPPCKFPKNEVPVHKRRHKPKK